MPCLSQLGLVLDNNPLDFTQFMGAKAVIPLKFNRVEPKLGAAIFSGDVNVNWFNLVVCIKEKTITFFTQQRWHWHNISYPKQCVKAAVPITE